jgi:excisionase family DNA binding protein
MRKNPGAEGASQMNVSGDWLSTREVARLAGVGPSAVKRWSDAGLLVCRKTAGGHRRFARADVDRVLRRQAGEPAAGDPWVEALLEVREASGVASLLLEERARAGAWHRVAERTGLAVAELGRRWQSGDISIAEEHLVSERLARALARLADSIPLPSLAPVALLTCAEGDDHTLGLSLVELVLHEAGWSTRWTGRRTPHVDVERLLREGEVGLLAVSASAASADAVWLRRQAEALGRCCRVQGTTLVLGGSGAWPARPRHGSLVRSLGELHLLAVSERERRSPPPVA